jgi:hypothetical protein
MNYFILFHDYIMFNNDTLIKKSEVWEPLCPKYTQIQQKLELLVS